MSLSSMAQDSALRLGTSKPDTEQLLVKGTTVAAGAVEAGSSPAEAAEQGQRAAKAAAEPATVTVSPGPLSELVKYVPTETIALYVALQAAFGEIPVPTSGKIADANFGSRWTGLAALLVATIILTIGLSYRAQRNAQTKTFKFPLFEVAAAGAAFLVWSLSLPSTPLLDFAGFDYSAWNSFIILTGTVSISTAAYILGKTVSWQKVAA